jgi:hypothetical protein
MIVAVVFMEMIVLVRGLCGLGIGSGFEGIRGSQRLAFRARCANRTES